MNRISFDRIGETLISHRLENGLQIYIVPKQDFQKSYAFFATKYGSIDMRFKLEGELKDTPAGVAHFLEHKMFDTKDGNALQMLSQNGASPNAFTSFAMTAYHFESTEKFEENLKILLDFVSVPWFTKESVEKEQGIIGQEIRMYEDSPDWRVYENMFAAMYENHPIRTNIAGTVESIAQITDQTLYDCHRAFYDPSNMVLCVAGNVDAQQIIDLAESILPRQPGAPIERLYGQEDHAAVSQNSTTQKMEVSIPLFMLGFKDDPAGQGDGALRHELTAELACEMLGGLSSPLYARLYAQGLVNSNFETGYMGFPGGGCILFSGESSDPEKVKASIMEELSRVNREGFDPALFSRLKKASFGSRLRGLNSFGEICRRLAVGYFDGAQYLRFPEIFDEITLSDISSYLSRIARGERAVLSVVSPLGH